MFSLNSTLPGLAVVAVVSATSSGIDATKAIFTPPPITGTASYDAPVDAGETVLVPWVIEKTTDCPGSSSRTWRGEAEFSLSEPMQANSLPKGTIRPRIQTKIPELAPPGFLHLFIKGYYQCEGQEKMHFTLGPVEFSVRGGK